MLYFPRSATEIIKNFRFIYIHNKANNTTIFIYNKLLRYNIVIIEKVLLCNHYILFIQDFSRQYNDEIQQEFNQSIIEQLMIDVI